jgi:hypothetical protein
MAAIGDIGRFKTPQKLVSDFGLNPRVRQSGLGAAHHGRISKVGRSHARAMLVEAAWAAAKARFELSPRPRPLPNAYSEETSPSFSPDDPLFPPGRPPIEESIRPRRDLANLDVA